MPKFQIAWRVEVDVYAEVEAKSREEAYKEAMQMEWVIEVDTHQSDNRVYEDIELDIVDVDIEEVEED